MRRRIQNAATSGAMGAVAIGVLGWAGEVSATATVIAPFGASCVLLCAAPAAPFSQPKAVIGGHVVASLVGLAVAAWAPTAWWSIALAVGLAIMAMQATGTLHPPAGANPIVILALRPDWSFVLFPVLIGSVALVGLAWAMRRSGAWGLTGRAPKTHGPTP